MDYEIGVKPLSEGDGGGYVAWVPALGEGLKGYGESADSAVRELLQLAPTFLDVVAESGQKLPEPRLGLPDLPSGRFNVRIPRTLHADLIRVAEQNGVSLNQLVTALLSVGAARAQDGSLTGVAAASRLTA